MDKIVFLATLAGKLSEYPMPAEDIEKSVASVKSFLDKISDADFAAEPPTDEDAAEMAKDLYEKYVALNSAKEEAQRSEAEPEVEVELEIEAEIEVEAETEAAIEVEVETEPVTVAEEAIAEEAVAEEVVPELTLEDIFVTEEEPNAPAEELAAEDYLTLAEEILLEEEPPAPEEILGQLQVPTYEEEATISSDEDFFEMLAKEAESERSDQARIEELELKALAMASKDDPEMVAAILSKDEKLGEMVANNAAIDEFDPIEGAFDPEEHPDIAFEESELTKVFSTDTAISREFSIDEDKLKKLDEDDKKPKKVKKEKKEREKVKGTPLFWTLFILTLPITLPLFLTVCALFGVAYSFVTALIIGCCAAMLSVVVAGTALALIGIIYGIIECFDTVSIGLYEIGVGIIVGGVTMLVSVLLTNLAIRLIPKLYKQIGRLGSYVFGKIGDLYTKIKKECGKKK